MTLLVDTGPLVAVINPADSYHAECTAAMQALDREPMITTWQCFTEAMHFLGRDAGYRLQDALWNMRRTGLLRIHATTDSEADRMDFLMRQYRYSMDLADTSLVVAAESLALRRLFTIDSDFQYYILADGSVLEVIR